MGVRKLMPEPPDLILSGINSGSNIADDVTYSGTVAGAMEGTLLGIRSIALSQAYVHDADVGRVVPWETAEALAPALLQQAGRHDAAAGRLPQRQFSQLRARRGRGRRRHRSRASWSTISMSTSGATGAGLPYYWLRFGRETEDVRAGSDLHALQNRQDFGDAAEARPDRA